MKAKRSHFWILLLIASGLSVESAQGKTLDQWAPFTQPDGTVFGGHMFGDEIEINWVTADGYEFVYNHQDGYFYYAELNSQGGYRASSAKVGMTIRQLTASKSICSAAPPGARRCRPSVSRKGT